MNYIEDLADYLINSPTDIDEPSDVRFSVTFSPEENRRLEVVANAIGGRKSKIVPMAAMALVSELEKRFNLTDSNEYKRLLADKSVSPSDIVFALKINGWENDFSKEE